MVCLVACFVDVVQSTHYVPQLAYYLKEEGSSETFVSSIFFMMGFAFLAGGFFYICCGKSINTFLLIQMSYIGFIFTNLLIGPSTLMEK